jgi:hypothetical protein
VVPENMLHTPVICSTRISKAKWHRYVAKHAERCDERGRELIGPSSSFGGNPNRHQGNTRAPRSRIHNLIDSWQRKGNFGTCFIQPGEIYTHPPFPLLFS